MRLPVLLGLGLLVPAAHAFDLSVDAYYTADASVRIEDRDSNSKLKLDDGKGEGLRVVAWPVNNPMFFSAELANVRDAKSGFQVEGEDFTSEARYQQIRVGLGVINRSAFYSRFEVVHSDLRNRERDAANLLVANEKRDAIGLTALVGIAGAFHPRLLGSIEVGYQDLDLLEDSDDGEAEFGRGFIGTARIDVPVHSRIQVFGEYRYQQGRSNNTGTNLQTDLSEARIGLRFNVL
ncbi:hypothetical protein [Polycyclovorans algicola]|uniref:hypothetical protein n=1 Tax=Polycyclovorans algicola TaxID=616992 RepID=UPI0004A6F510|nr:hypothetical protein [Polycyclovorans algicola]